MSDDYDSEGYEFTDGEGYDYGGNGHDKDYTSVEEWQTKLLEKYTYLKNVADDNLSGLWDSLEFELSIQKILNIRDVLTVCGYTSRCS